MLQTPPEPAPWSREWWAYILVLLLTGGGGVAWHQIQQARSKKASNPSSDTIKARDVMERLDTIEEIVRSSDDQQTTLNRIFGQTSESLAKIVKIIERDQDLREKEIKNASDTLAEMRNMNRLLDQIERAQVKHTDRIDTLISKH